jgi:hypothetical protein
MQVGKIRSVIPEGALSLNDIERYNDRPVAEGTGATLLDAVQAMAPVKWQAPRS